jgi:hypothetical protein
MVDEWTIPKAVGAWALSHPIETFGIYVGLKSPRWRGWILEHLLLAGRGAVTGARASLGITARQLVVPALSSSSVQTAGIIAAPVVAAAVGAAGVTAAQQAVDIVGPSAPKATSPFPSTKKAPFNPFFMGWGSVV